jgi:hypothetical protein
MAIYICEIGDVAPTMYSNVILPLFFQLCDFAPPFGRWSLRQPLFVTLLGDKHLKKIKEIEKD